MQAILNVLEPHLTNKLFFKLRNFLNDDLRPELKRKTICWEDFKETLDTLNLESCSENLIALLNNIESKDSDVKTFHINKNQQVNSLTEPNVHNTNKMIFKCFNYIYKRNVLASLVKFIILKSYVIKIEQSELADEKRGIFFFIVHRLKQIIFESVLISFNGANYDNYLICNDLLQIMSRRKEKMKIFKKGASISTIHLKCKKNFIYNDTIERKGVKKNGQWLMNLYVKDLRNLVSANMSLDKLGKMFNLKVSKLCFPYDIATSVSILKNETSLHPRDELFWKNSFNGKVPSVEERLHAQEIYEQHNFANLYDFGTFYLAQDCLLLHEILLTLFQSYLSDGINLFTRRNYSQSSLSYQQFFIVYPSQQIEKLLAPKQITHPVYNYLIKQAVTGGLCTSFVHGSVGAQSTTPINHHFNNISFNAMNPKIWPNFSKLNPLDHDSFKEKASGIVTVDIRSLYPSAALKKIPVGVPHFYSRFTQEDSKISREKLPTTNLRTFCSAVHHIGSHDTDTFKLLSKNPWMQQEYQVLNFYLKRLPKNITIIRFQSAFTALGQLTFVKFPVDGFLTYRDANNVLFIKIIQYHSSFFHGHKDSCSHPSKPLDSEKKAKTLAVKNEINNAIQKLKTFYRQDNTQVNIEYVEIYDCDFNQHRSPYLSSPMSRMRKHFSYQSFLDTILNKQLTGFLVVKNLEIKKTSQNPIFGFVIQKVEYGYDQLSPYSKTQTDRLCVGKRVISVQKSKSYMVISTEYFCWLEKTFGFETEPDIYHALFFQLDDYLRNSLEYKLKQRKDIKECIKQETDPEIRQNLEVKAELIKLMLNSCYGYTLCNLASTKFKKFENRRYLPRKALKKGKNKNKNYCIKLTEFCYLVEIGRTDQKLFQSLLGHVGCYILYNSKIILLKRLYYLLKYLDPTCAQLLYMDTDSAHFLLKHQDFVCNVHPELKTEFLQQFDKHFDSGNKISGIWVKEGFFQCAEYLGEKSYRLFNTDNATYVTHMKGLNAAFQKDYHTNNVSIKEKPIIHFNYFFKSPDFVIFKSHMSKDIFARYVPVKRFFVTPVGSFPLSL